MNLQIEKSRKQAKRGNMTGQNAAKSDGKSGNEAQKGEDCLFCKIIDGEIPSKKVYEDESVYAFNDIAPQAAVHVLIIPKSHVENVAALARKDSNTLSHIAEVAQSIADEKYHGNYRLVFNTGEDAGQTVFHAHAHVLTGEKLD